MVTLDELIDRALLDEMLEQGYVRRQVHPDLPLTIFNYTEKAAYDGVWNEATLQCRGLIVNGYGAGVEEVLARPFRKFFNYGQNGAPELALDAPAIVTDKLDGSLGILYACKKHASGMYAVATRGSFASPQALHATKVWQERYAGVFEPLPDCTYLFEIVYPSNRIVVDYAGLDDLVLLAVLSTSTGLQIRTDSLAGWGWPGPHAAVHEYASLADALAAPDPGNSEGFVLYFPESDDRVKVKHEEYVRLHRIITGLSARRIWTLAGICDLSKLGLNVKQIGRTLMVDVSEVEGALGATVDGDWMRPLIEQVPDEFENWVRDTAAMVHAAVDEWEHHALRTFDGLGLGWERRRDLTIDRKAAAAVICALPKAEQGAQFALLDGKPIRPYAWRETKPAHDPFWARTEDVA